MYFLEYKKVFKLEKQKNCSVEYKKKRKKTVWNT